MHNRDNTPPISDPRPSAGFTLVELLVVIGIIVLLMTIAMVAGPAVLGVGKQKQTEATLLTAQTLLNEYLALSNQKQILTGTSPDGGDKYRYAVPTIDVLIQRAEKNTKLQDILATFDDEALVKEGTGWVLYDGWKNPIVFNASGEEDGMKGFTPNSPYEDHDLPEKKRPYFVSMGEDGELGRWDNGTTGSPKDEPATSGSKWDEDNDNAPDAADNIFSYDLR